MKNQYPDSVRFEDTDLSIIDNKGKPWITSTDLARALGYGRLDTVARIFKRNEDEFTDEMSLTVNLTLRGQVAPTPHRIFSARGARLVTFFARTEKAKAFRAWVLDVLEGIELPHQSEGLPIILDGKTALQLNQEAMENNIVRARKHFHDLTSALEAAQKAHTSVHDYLNDASFLATTIKSHREDKK